MRGGSSKCAVPDISRGDVVGGIPSNEGASGP
jgi:hypothetical protein